jgi:hypothetical protein
MLYAVCKILRAVSFLTNFLFCVLFLSSISCTLFREYTCRYNYLLTLRKTNFYDTKKTRHTTPSAKKMADKLSGYLKRHLSRLCDTDTVGRSNLDFGFKPKYQIASSSRITLCVCGTPRKDVFFLFGQARNRPVFNYFSIRSILTSGRRGGGQRWKTVSSVINIPCVTSFIY